MSEETPALPALVTYDDFSKIKLRIAEILNVQPHPKADRLYVLEIKIGEEIRQIVAGIKQHYSEEELKGKKIVVVENMQPAVIRGVESKGMLLAASDDSGLTLVTPERPIRSGAGVK